MGLGSEGFDKQSEVDVLHECFCSIETERDGQLRVRISFRVRNKIRVRVRVSVKGKLTLHGHSIVDTVCFPR